MVINAVDYSSRLLSLEHVEEAYRDSALLTFRNNDRAFDAVDLTGRLFGIGYGHTTGATPATWAATTAYSVGGSVQPVTPDGKRYYCVVAGTSGGTQPTWPTIGNTVVDGTVTWEYGCSSGDEYSNSATLWVKSQQLISSEGQLLCQLYCEGMWTYLREQRIMFVGSAPGYDYEWTTKTPYGIIEEIIETGFSWTLLALATSDGIMDVFLPVFTLNDSPYENATAVLERLIAFTKSYLRAKAGKVFEVVYPQTSDAPNETYYSNQAHYFIKYTEKKNVDIPNRVVVFCNNPDNLVPWPTPVMTGDTGAYSGQYVEVMESFVDRSITVQGDANLRAAAILTKVKSEQLAGVLIVPHDARVELYDKVKVMDVRGL